MSEWYYSSGGYLLFALSTYSVETDASLFSYKVFATLAMCLVSIVHCIKGVRFPMSTWILALAHLIYVASYGAFIYTQYA